jgi:hypothetical protein
MTTITLGERAAIREGFSRLLAAKASEADLRQVMATSRAVTG